MFAILLLACADPAPTWHADVRPIFESRCLSCHAEDAALSGLPLHTYDRVAPIADVVGDSVAARTMPPWLADPDCNDYAGDYSLSDEDRQTILDWVDAGAPEGDPETAAPAADPWVAPELDRIDATLEMPVDYTPTSAPDDYRCFLIEWPYDEEVYVTGYDVVPGNTDVVHHVIPFVIDPGDADAYRELDDADPEPGYTCYGGPGGDVQTLIDTSWLGSWAPGSGATVMPEGGGLRVKPGSLIALQMHYYVSAEPGSDRTAVQVQVTDTVERRVMMQPWTDVAWLFGVGMEIPAGSEGVEHRFVYENTEDDGTYTLHDAALHMHTLGRSGWMKVHHADGETSCLIDMPSYDFNWQRSYAFEEPVEIEPGDTLELSCTWDNPGDTDVAWGDGTGDEMCLSITMLSWWL